MGTTTNYAIRYPTLGDPPNGPAQIQNAADDIDAALKTVDTALDARLDTIEGAYSRGIGRYGVRETSGPTSTSTTAVAVQRVDTIAVVAGRAIIVNLTCHPTSSVLSDGVRIDVRGVVGGTATASSPVLKNGQFYMQPLGFPMSWRFVYLPVATGNLSIVACVARNAGSGACGFYADGTRNLELWTESMNVVTDTGTDL